MSLSIHASAQALAATAKSKPEHALNPAQQARAADPAAKGAAFGALVSQFAKAKHAPAPIEPPADTTTQPPVETTTSPPAETGGAALDITA